MNDSKAELASLDQIDSLLRGHLGVQGGEESQSASPKCKEDVVVLTLHAAMLANGFRLTECNNQSLGRGLYFMIANVEERPVGLGRGALPTTWNDEGPDRYALRYNHRDAEGTNLIRLSQIEDLLSVQCRSAAGGALINVEVNPDEYIAPSTFPLQATDVSSVFQQQGLGRLLKVLHEGLIRKIMPEKPASNVNLQEGGRYVSNERLELPLTQPPSLRESEPLLPRAQHPPFPPGEFPPPGFEDEHQMYDRPRAYMDEQGRSIFSIGHDDLNPPGLGNPSLMGPFFGGPGGGGGGGGGGGDRGMCGDRGNGGMYPSSDHPMFGRRRDPNSDGRRGPPGSRWDPTGPPGPSFGGFGSGGGGIL